MRDICESCLHFMEIETVHNYPELRKGKIRYCPILGQKIDGTDAVFFVSCSRFESNPTANVPVEPIPDVSAEKEKTIPIELAEDKRRGFKKLRK